MRVYFFVGVGQLGLRVWVSVKVSLKVSVTVGVEVNVWDGVRVGLTEGVNVAAPGVADGTGVA